MSDVLLGEVTMTAAAPVMTEKVDLTKDVVEVKASPTGTPTAATKVVVEEKKSMNILPYLIGAGVLYYIISKKFFKK
jgi:phenylpyruvate tautomerase PptA (4-oxalocrotonate tautomerase family)